MNAFFLACLLVASTGAASPQSTTVAPAEGQFSETAKETPPRSGREPPALRGAPARERFLQHALGTQGDVRVPALLFSLTLLLAVVVVAWKRMRARRRSGPLDEDDDLPPEIPLVEEAPASSEDSGAAP